MRYAIDFHGVIADPTSLTINLAKKKYGVDLRPDQCTRSKAGEVMGSRYDELVAHIESSPRLLEYHLMQGCVQELGRLKESGNTVLVMSSLPRQSIPFARLFLKIHEVPYAHWISSDSVEKTKLCLQLKVDRLIDDDPLVVHSALHAGIEALLFDRACNKDANDLPRLYGWNDLARCGW